MDYKILIIGAGPSGAAAAIFLARKGFEVTVVERGSRDINDLKIGESLPPNAHQLLAELDLWEEFQAAGHLKCYGNKSIWGSEEMAFSDFIHHPLGYGWHIDRALFEEMLIDKASSLGAIILNETTVHNAFYNGSSWNLELKTGNDLRSIKEADFIIDASGRNSFLARKLGINRLYESQQLALIAFLKTEKPFQDTTSLIETAKEGWWYSTKIPGDKIATAFMSKPNKVNRKNWIEKDNWWDLLSKSIYTSQRIMTSEAILIKSPKFVSADSSILEKLSGDGWIAIGDAAMAYDPIASHGLLMGMVSARDASLAIQQSINGNKDALKAYDVVLWAAFQNYSKQRITFYEAERRFTDSEYWNSILEIGA